MNSHKNARLTFRGRRLLMDRIAQLGLGAAAQSLGVSTNTARKWHRRFLEKGQTACSSAAHARIARAARSTRR